MDEINVKCIERLADSELDVMHVIWQAEGPLSALEIARRLSDTHSWKKQTVHVLLKRLEDKGFIEPDKSGYVHTFGYAISEREYFATESESLLKRIGGDFKALAVSMFDTDGITEGDISAIEEMLARKKKELRSKRNGG